MFQAKKKQKRGRQPPHLVERKLFYNHPFMKNREPRPRDVPSGSAASMRKAEKWKQKVPLAPAPPLVPSMPEELRRQLGLYNKPILPGATASAAVFHSKPRSGRRGQGERILHLRELGQQTNNLPGGRSGITLSKGSLGTLLQTMTQHNWGKENGAPASATVTISSDPLRPSAKNDIEISVDSLYFNNINPVDLLPPEW